MSWDLNPMVIDVDGFVVDVVFEFDEDGHKPWDNDEGASAFVVYARGGQPTRRGHEFLYMGCDWWFDVDAALEVAKKEQWNAMPYDAPDGHVRAVNNLCKYYKAWLHGEWTYVTVTAQLRAHPLYEVSVGRVETSEKYHHEAAQEYARDVVNEYLSDLERNTLRGVTTDTPAMVNQK